MTPSSAKKEPAAQDDLSPEAKQAATNAKRAATRAANKAIKDASGDTGLDGRPEPKKRGPKPGAKAAAEAAGKARGSSDDDEDVEEDLDDINIADDSEISAAKAASAATGKGFVYSDADDDDAPVQQVMSAGATADPVKDYLKQIGKVALLNAEQREPVKLKGLLLNYGVYDHMLETPSYQEFGEGYGLTKEKMRFYWDAYCPDAVARMSPFASPIRGELSSLPPALMHIAELDVLASENLAFAEKLRMAGVSLELQTFPGTVHGFARAIGFVGAADRAAEAAGAWLKARFAS